MYITKLLATKYPKYIAMSWICNRMGNKLGPKTFERKVAPSKVPNATQKGNPPIMVKRKHYQISQSNLIKDPPPVNKCTHLFSNLSPITLIPANPKYEN